MAKKLAAILGWICILILIPAYLSGCGSKQPELGRATAAPADIPAVESSSATPSSTPGEDTNSPAKQATSSSARPTSASGEDIDAENGAEQIEWGQQVDPEKLLELARSGDVFEIQWHVMPNVIRFMMNDGKIYHLKNAEVSIDILKFLENAGIKVGKEGITFRYSFCN